jgi:tetratricopeptide (TPR) repeat protein
MEKIDLETGIDDSGLLSHQVVSDAEYTVSALRQEFDAAAEWQDEVRAHFHQALTEARPDVAVALAHAAMLYAYTPNTQFEFLNLQGIGLTKMIEAGGVDGRDPLELLDFRVASFEKALLALPPDRGWDNGDVLCRIRLAMAWQEAGVAKSDIDLLHGARAEYAVLLPALKEGRWGYAMHAKTAEIAALLAQTSDEMARLGGDIDPLPLWLDALNLSLDPQLRAIDTLGYWDAAMDLIEPWLEYLPDHPDARNACAAVRDGLQALNLPPDNPDHGWVQHFIGKMALAAGLQADGLRSEAKDAEDEAELLQSVAASRLALVAVESGDSQGWVSTAFHLAYALHALGEARRDSPTLAEAIGLYEQVAARLANPDGMEEDLYLAQVRINLSEAMAQKGEIIGDVAIARAALNIATDAHMAFTLWGHDEGFEVAEANCERISATINLIESR